MFGENVDSLKSGDRVDSNSTAANVITKKAHEANTIELYYNQIYFKWFNSTRGNSTVKPAKQPARLVELTVHSKCTLLAKAFVDSLYC